MGQHVLFYTITFTTLHVTSLPSLRAHDTIPARHYTSLYTSRHHTSRPYTRHYTPVQHVTPVTYSTRHCTSLHGTTRVHTTTCTTSLLTNSTDGVYVPRRKIVVARLIIFER